MTWKNNIASCFGTEDKNFAQHTTEKTAAVNLLVQSQKQNVGWREYLVEIEDWLKSQTPNGEHISREMIKVKELSNYFKND